MRFAILARGGDVACFIGQRGQLICGQGVESLEHFFGAAIAEVGIGIAACLFYIQAVEVV